MDKIVDLKVPVWRRRRLALGVWIDLPLREFWIQSEIRLADDDGRPCVRILFYIGRLTYNQDPIVICAGLGKREWRSDGL